MPYARRSRSGSRGGYTRGRSVRAAPRRSTRRSSVRRGSRSSGGGGTLRIVIEQPGASAVSRYPGVAAKLNPAPRKAKY